MPQLFVLSVLALFAALSLHSTSAEAPEPLCSLIPIPGIKRTGEPYFLGRATPETLVAGPGETVPASGRGHYGTAQTRAVYGQVIAVERSGGSDVSSEVIRADTVVVVPWDYDSGCDPVYWTGSARWLEPELQRFFYPQLRDRAHWVRSLPTYDAFFPGVDVHPAYTTQLSPMRTGVFRRRDRQAATPEEVFGFYDALPSTSTTNDLHEEAFSRVRDWAKRNPRLAASTPISEVLFELAWHAQETRARHVRAPMLGTYRLTITFPGATPKTLYLRTSDRTDGLFTKPRPEVERRRDPLEMRSLGFDIKFWIAGAEHELPAKAERQSQSSWGWHVAWPDSVRANGEWPAEIDLEEFFDRWQDSSIVTFRDKYHDWFGKAWARNEVPIWLGAFHGDSQQVFRQRVKVGSAQTMVIEAVRISRVTVPDSTAR